MAADSHRFLRGKCIKANYKVPQDEWLLKLFSEMLVLMVIVCDTCATLAFDLYGKECFLSWFGFKGPSFRGAVGVNDLIGMIGLAEVYKALQQKGTALEFASSFWDDKMLVRCQLSSGSVPFGEEKH